MPRWSIDGGIHEIPLPPGVPGALWLCGKHRIGPDVGALLKSIDARSVVCLTERHELEERYPEYVGWLSENSGQAAIWFPIPDLSAPPLATIDPLLDTVSSRLLAGDRIVMHCAAGIGRAGTAAVALLIVFGMELDQATDLVRANRPMAGPEVGSQQSLVEELAARTRKRATDPGVPKR